MTLARYWGTQEEEPGTIRWEGGQMGLLVDAKKKVSFWWQKVEGEFL